MNVLPVCYTPAKEQKTLYHNDEKDLKRNIKTTDRAKLDQQSDQGLQCLALHQRIFSHRQMY